MKKKKRKNEQEFLLVSPPSREKLFLHDVHGQTRIYWILVVIRLLVVGNLNSFVDANPLLAKEKKRSSLL